MGNSRANLQTSVPLSNLSIKIGNAPGTFKARALFPAKPVKRGTGKVRVYSGDNMIQEAPPQGRRSEAPEIERKYGTIAFSTERFALREFISGRDKRDADDDIADIEQDAVADLTERLMLGLEKAAITKAFTSTNYDSANYLSLTNGWESASSDPIAEINTAQDAVILAMAGLPADSLALGHVAYGVLCRHPDIVDRVKYQLGQVAVVNETSLSTLFGLQVHVIGAVENTAQPGTAGTVTKAHVVSDKALVYRSAGPDGLRSAAFGRMLVPPGGEFSVTRYQPANGSGVWIEASLEYALQFMAVNNVTDGDSIGGYLFANVGP
jgi:hypothetical protein